MIFKNFGVSHLEASHGAIGATWGAWPSSQPKLDPTSWPHTPVQQSRPTQGSAGQATHGAGQQGSSGQWLRALSTALGHIIQGCDLALLTN